MKTLIMSLLLALAMAGTSFAGVVRGTLSEEGELLGEGYEIEIRHGTKVYRTLTDQYSRYRLTVPEEGLCRLTVVGEEQEPSVSIISSGGTRRYNLNLVWNEDKEEYVLEIED
ncbi:MAG: hypothetical protein GY867_07325 [bacterium]|nr:hypothetical protein [bacterium]